jgi:hypothetical protein
MKKEKKFHGIILVGRKEKMRIVRSCLRRFFQLLFVFPAVLLCSNRTAVIFHSLEKGASESKRRQSVRGFPGPQGREGLPSRLSGIDVETTQASVICDSFLIERFQAQNMNT